MATHMPPGLGTLFAGFEISKPSELRTLHKGLSYWHANGTSQYADMSTSPQMPQEPGVEGAFRRFMIGKIVAEMKERPLIREMVGRFMATEPCDEERFQLAADEMVGFIGRLYENAKDKSAHAVQEYEKIKEEWRELHPSPSVSKGGKEINTEMHSTENGEILDQRAGRSKEDKRSRHRSHGSPVQKLGKRKHPHHSRRDKGEGKPNDTASDSTKNAGRTRKKIDSR